ncbi:MAG: hypothetical protein LQ346_005289, partial [Caloplaca aetnensis]
MQANVGSDKQDATPGGDGEVLHSPASEPDSHNSSSANKDSSAEDNHQDAPSPYTGIGDWDVKEGIAHLSASSGLQLELEAQVLQTKFKKKHFR